MYSIKVKIKYTEVVFSGLKFNEDEELEFTSVNVDFLNNFKFIFNEEREKLELIGGHNISMLVDLTKSQAERLKEIKREIKINIVNFVNKLLSGEEEFLFLDIDTDEFPYIVTNLSVLDSKVKSPKYDGAMEYVFSEKVLKKANKKVNFKFGNHEEFQRELGKEIKKRNLKSNYDFKGQKALKLKWGEIVS